MLCHCGKKAVFSGPALCREHFINYFENKVISTINEFKLIKEKDKETGICIAVSGGKDSLTVLYILNKYFGNVAALAVDEGIKGYRNRTLFDLEKFCKKFRINYDIVSFEKEFGITLDSLLKNKKMRPCIACGILRRFILNKHSKKYGIIATGHNLDDECQSIVMNFLNNNTLLLPRMGPVTGDAVSETTGENSVFTKRIKPLYFCPEKEVLAYSIIMGFDVSYNECPNAEHSFRASVRDFLNEIEIKQPGTKKRIIENSLKIAEKIRKKENKKENEISCCEICYEPSRNEICNACKIIEGLKA